MYLSCSGRIELIHDMTYDLARGVVNIRFKFYDPALIRSTLCIKDHGAHHAWRIVISLSSAHSYFFDRVAARQLIIRPYRSSYRSSGRGYVLAAPGRLSDDKRVVGSDICNRRHRNTQYPVHRPYRPAALSDRRDHDLVYTDLIHTNRGSNYVNYRIYGTDLMKVDLVHTHTVSLGLGTSQYLKYSFCKRSCPLTHIGPIEDIIDLLQPTVHMVVRVSMSMSVMLVVVSVLMSIQIVHVMIVILVFLIEPYIEITYTDSALFLARDHHIKAISRHRIQDLPKLILRHPKV